MRKLAYALVIAILVPSLFGQELQNTARGFDPEKSFQMGDYDHINNFNGNVVVSIPIGPTFSPGGNLKYGLHLVYNGNTWSFARSDSQPESIPNRYCNAGLGWQLTLGDLVAPKDPLQTAMTSAGNWLFGGPDGAEHVFYFILHNEEFGTAYAGSTATALGTVVGYTRDGSYLRLVRGARNAFNYHLCDASRYGCYDWQVDYKIESPDGTISTFRSEVAPDVPRTGPSDNSLPESIDEALYYQLVRVEDRFGNYLNVTYSSDGLTWTLQDGTPTAAGRTHTVQLLPKTFYDYYGSAAARNTIDSVSLAGFQSADVGPLKPTYKFNYGPYESISKSCDDTYPGNTRSTFFLNSITQPDGSQFAMTYNKLFSDSSGTTCTRAPGHLVGLTLPTGGRIAYTTCGSQSDATDTGACFRTFPQLDDPSGAPGKQFTSTRHHSATISARTLYDANNVALGSWTWRSALTSPHQVQVGTGQYQTLYQELIVTETDPFNNTTALHYNVDLTGGGCQFGGSGDTYAGDGYSLPYTNAVTTSDGLSLSTESFDGQCTMTATGADAGCARPSCVDANQKALTPMRTSYVAYAMDGGMGPDAIDGRLQYQRIVYNDDTGCGGLACSQDTFYGDFDGLGHYRTKHEKSNFPDANERITTIHFNANPTVGGSYFVGATPSTYMLSPADPWLTGVYDFVDTTQDNNFEPTLDGHIARQEFNFNRRTGFLLTRRTLANGTSESCADVLATFADSNGVGKGDGSGNVELEQYAGGDAVPRAGNPNPGCTSFPGTQYSITHKYSSGTLQSSTYDGTFFTEDYDVDPGSGLVTKSRDSAGQETSFTYDSMFRVKEQDQPSGGAKTTLSYSYSPPSVTANISILGTDNLWTAAKSLRYYYDGLGRLIETKTQMPNDAAGEEWSTVQKKYDAAGRLSSVSEPVYTPSDSSEDLGTQPAVTYQYDYLGRPTVTSNPDGSSLVRAYTGGRVVVRTTMMNGAVDPPDNSVTETYDAAGRLASVTENSLTDSTKTPPAHNPVTTTYTYNTRDQLTSAKTTAPPHPQVRVFHYDDRGFLTKEFHPEYGFDSNGVENGKSYTYDSRGHLRSSTIGSVQLSYQLDSAERLVEVLRPLTSTTDQLLKTFTFASANPTANGETNYEQGRLDNAVRHNYLSVDGSDTTVTDQFEYDRVGRVTKKTTSFASSLDDGSNTKKLVQSYDLDGLGNMTTLHYPTFSIDDPTFSAKQARDLSQTFDQGFLTHLNVNGGTNNDTTLAYFPAGGVRSIAHADRTIDTVTQDANNQMPRPTSITVNYGDCDGSPVINAQPSDATVLSGSTAALSVSASDSDSLTYQWYDAVTGQPISDATANSYTTVPLIQSTSYYVVVFSSCSWTKSRTAKISIGTVASSCPTVTAPQTVRADPGTAATLTAQTTGSVADLIWYQGASPNKDHPLTQCQGSTCPVHESDGTQFWVAPGSAACSESGSGTITVTWGPLCALPPVIDSLVDADATVTTGGSAHHLTVTPQCADAGTTYGWRSQVLPSTTHDPLPGLTDPEETVTPLNPPCVGACEGSRMVTTTYYATVSEPDPNTQNNVTVESAPVTAHVLSCPDFSITAQPADRWVVQGATAHLVVDAGTGSYTYQWYQLPCGEPSKDPTKVACGDPDVVSGDPHSISRPSVAASYDTDPIFEKSYFWVRVNGPDNGPNKCSADSRKVAVNVCPFLQSQPQGVTVTPIMNRAVLRITVGGDGPFQYQWYQGESRDTSHPVVNGNDPILQVNVDQTTTFWIRVSNDACVAVNSHSATVTYCHPPEITTQPQPYQLRDVGGTILPTLTVDSNLSTAIYGWYEYQSADDDPATGRALDPTGKTVTLTGLAPGVHFVRARVSTSDYTLTTGCSSYSNVAVVEMCAPPSIVSGVNNVTIPAGQAANFIIGVDQPGATVDWYLSDPDSTTVPAPPVYAMGTMFGPRPDQTTTYWLRADNGKCQSATSKVTVFICTPKITGITVTPSQQITELTPVTLQVDAVGDATPVSIAWYTGTTAPTTLVGEGSSVIVTPLVDTTYWAEVSAPCPQVPYVVTSNPVTITVCHPPHITGSTPSTQVVAVNEYINLWTTTTGTNVQSHWYKGAVGDTSAPVTSTNFSATLADAGDYWVNVTADCGSAVTATAHVDVCSPPVITSPPANRQVQSGSTTMLSVTATGTNLTYSWMRINADSTETEVGTSASYTTDALTVATQYYVIVTSQGHCAAAKVTVTVSVCSAPQFTTAPPVVYANSGPVNLDASVDDPNATITWYATDPRLGPATVVTSPVNPTATTTYWAQAQDGICLSGVTTETVTICTPQFTSVTPSQTITENNPVTLTAAATGPSITYKWWTGTTSPTTQIATSNSILVTPTTDTNYWAEAQCNCPITTYPLRQQVTITVCHLPSITSAPAPTQNVTVGDWVVINATTTGTNVQVHWYKGAVGDKSTPFTVTNGGFYATANDSGTYWVEAAGTCGTATASTVVDVCVPPVITAQPVGTQVQSGNSAMLTVAATGTTLTYDWYIVNADNTQTYAGSGTSFSTGALTANTNYVARVTSRGRCYTSSNQVTVSVCTIPQITYLTPSQTVGMQQPVTLYVSASGTSMQYEWRNLSTNQLIATTYSTNVAPTATTSYSVRVYSGICSVTSATVTLTVCGPTITQQPASKTIAYGTSTSLTVAAVGDGTITAQWYRGALRDTSSPAGTGLTVTVQPPVSTQYWVRVATPCRSVDSASALVTVSGCTQPAISAQSGNTTIASDQSVTLSVTAQNTWDMHYQWYLWDPSSSAWSAISSATSTTYVENPTTVSNTYMASLWNSCGLTTNSSSMVITRTPACYPAAITTQPQSVTYNAGSSVTFSVAASGTGVHYQWYGADPTGGAFVALTGQTASTLTISPQSQSASYYVVATANCGASAVSNTVTATRNCTPPAATTQTQSLTIRKNSWATLQFTATGTATIGYTWYASTTGSNFTQVATGSSYAVQPQVTTYYYAVASNSCGSVASSYITVTVTQCAPTISTQPASQTINSIQSVTLSVVATSGQLHYQWYISTGSGYTAISGAVAATLTYSPTATSYFYVNVYNDCGTVNSNAATVTVTPACYAPTVSIAGPDMFGADGTATLTASFNGTNPTLTFYMTPPSGQNPAVVGGPGTSTQALVYQPYGYTYYYYYVVATNPCGTATSSRHLISIYNP